MIASDCRYGEPLPPPRAVPEVVPAEGDARHGAGTLGAGYCFMDSPGDDLESISLDGL